MNKIFFALVIIASGLSFFAGYFLTRDTQITSVGATSEPTRSPGIPQTLKFPASGQTEPTIALSYGDIDRQVSIFDKLHYAHELAAQATIEDLEEYLNLAAASPDPLFNYNMVSVFLEKYTAMDPLGAIEFVDNHSRLPDQKFIIHVVTSWVRVDPEAAIDYFKGLDDPHIKNALAGRLLGDPTLRSGGFETEVLDVLGAQGRAMAGYLSVQQLPPSMAFEEALQLEPRTREGAMHQALARWMRDDPDAAVARVLEHPNLDERSRLMQGLLNTYISVDEDAAFEFAQQYLTDNVRTEQHTLAVLAQRNPRRTLPLLENFIARTGNVNPLVSLVSTWVQQEPEAALAYIDTVAENQRAHLYQSVAYSYVNSHPEQGFRWLLAQREEFPTMVRNTIGQSINHKTLPMAERTLTQVSDENLRTQLITGIGNYKASQDPQDALRWLEQHRTDSAYPIAVQNVIASMSHQNPRAAAEALENRLSDEIASPLAGQIATNWYRASPRDALAWARNLSNTDVRANALSNVVTMVAHQDPDEAINLINAIPEGQYRDDAKRNVAFSVISQDPSRVEQIIRDLQIPDSEARHMRELASNRSQNQTAAGVMRVY